MGAKGLRVVSHLVTAHLDMQGLNYGTSYREAYVMPILYIFLSVFSKLTCLGKPICFKYHWSNNIMIVNILMIMKIVMIINTIILIISHLQRF